MRRLGILLALAGCGRLGFDDVSGPGPNPDGPDGDAATALPNICNARVAGPLALGAETPTKVRATQLATGGFAVAIETDATNVYILRVDTNGSVVSMHSPMITDYALHGISQIADRPFVYVFTSGAGFIKMLVPSWNDYDTGPAGEQLTMDPQQALLPGGTLAMYGVIAGGTLNIAAIDVAGTTSVTADYAPPAGNASFAPTPSGVRVVVENTGTCETFAIAPDGTTGARHMFSPCHVPLLAMLDDKVGGVLHQISPGGPFAFHSIPEIATDPGATSALEIATNARITVAGDAIWVAYRRGNGAARFIRYGATGVTTSDIPAIAGAFDLLPKAAFWIDGSSLRTGEPCL